ncbi:MAG: hypothetical protein ACRD38_10360 [Nitrososphaerales archaeon]
MTNASINAFYTVAGDQMSEINDVSEDFIDTNRTLVRHMQKSSRPASKNDRFKRRQEVYRLHFEYSIPATRIAELMKVNRNTVNGDIKFWYGRLAKEWEESDIEAYLQKQVNRFEAQRTRLFVYLEKASDLEEKLSTERLLFDIDNKLTHLATNSYNSQITNWINVNKRLNECAEDEGLKGRWILPFELRKVTLNQYERIDKILNERRESYTKKENPCVVI